jgi:hypothetical protein
MLGHRVPRLIPVASMEAIGCHLGPQLAGWELPKSLLTEEILYRTFVLAICVQSECYDDPLQF